MPLARLEITAILEAMIDQISTISLFKSQFATNQSFEAWNHSSLFSHAINRWGGRAQSGCSAPPIKRTRRAQCVLTVALCLVFAKALTGLGSKL